MGEKNTFDTLTIYIIRHSETKIILEIKYIRVTRKLLSHRLVIISIKDYELVLK